MPPAPLVRTTEFKRRLKGKDKHDTAKVVEMVAKVATNPRDPTLQTKPMRGYPDTFELRLSDGNRLIYELKANGTVRFLTNCNHDVLRKPHG